MALPKFNPFEEFLNAYAGRQTVADELTNQATGDMVQAYENTYNAIFRAMSEARKDVNYTTFAAQTALLKQIGAELDKFKGTSGQYLQSAMTAISDYSTKVAIKDLGMIDPQYHNPEKWHVDYNRQYTEQAYKDAYSHIAGQTDKMAAQVKNMLREESAQVFRRAAVEGLSRKDAYKTLKDQVLAKDPNFEFVDRAGRTWDNRKYFEMLTRTVMMNTCNAAYLNTLVNEGQDLVIVSAHNAADGCREWEDKVLSITGKTPGYPTVDQARASGQIFHPRCKHRLLAYDDDIENVFEQAKQGKSREEILGSLLEEPQDDKPEEEAQPNPYTPKATLKEAQAWAKENGAFVLPKTATAAAEAYVNTLEAWGGGVNDPSYDRKKVLANWTKIFRKAEIGKMPDEKRLVIQNAINANWSNPKYREIVQRTGGEAVFFCKDYTGRTSAAGERMGASTFVFDSGFFNTTKVQPMAPGAMTSQDWGGYEAVLRHEMAHGLYSHLTAEQKTAWQNHYYEQERKQWREGFTAYAADKGEEAFSEIFALGTHPDYKPGIFPEWVDKHVSEVMRLVDEALPKKPVMTATSDKSPEALKANLEAAQANLDAFIAEDPKARNLLKLRGHVNEVLVGWKEPKTDMEVYNQATVLHDQIALAYKAYYGSLDQAGKEAERRAYLATRTRFIGYEESGDFAESRKESALNKTYNGTRHIPFPLLYDVLSNGVEIKWENTYDRGYWQPAVKGVFLYNNSGFDVVAHEVGHAIDSFLGGGRSGVFSITGGHWRDGPYVTEEDGNNFRQWFKKLTSGEIGTYENGDGQYWKGRFICDYEGRIYDRNGGDTGVEWFSMQSQYFARYLDKMDEFDQSAKSFAAIHKESGEEAVNHILDAYSPFEAECFADWIYGDTTYEKARQKYALEQADYRDVTGVWKVAKKYSPEFTQWLENFYGKQEWLASDPMEREE